MTTLNQERRMSFIEHALLAACGMGDAVNESYVQDAELAEGSTHILDEINARTKDGLEKLNKRFEQFVKDGIDPDNGKRYEIGSTEYAQRCSAMSNEIQQFQKKMEIEKNDANSNINRAQDMASRDSTNQQNFMQTVSPLMQIMNNLVSALAGL